MSKLIDKITTYVVDPVCPGCNKPKLTEKIVTESNAFWEFVGAYQFQSNSNKNPLRLCKGCYELFSKDAIIYQEVMAKRQQEENKEALEMQSIINLKRKSNLHGIETLNVESVV